MREYEAWIDEIIEQISYLWPDRNNPAIWDEIVRLIHLLPLGCRRPSRIQKVLK